MNAKNLPQFLLRIGLSFVFIFASIEIFLNPLSLIEFTPSFILEIIPQNVFMYTFAIFEILLALWLLSGKKLLIPSIVAALSMVMIVIFNLDRISVLFRNIAIMFAGLSLASMNWKQIVPKKEQVPADQNNPSQTPAVTASPPQAVNPAPAQSS